MKNLLKSEVCGSHEQCTRPTCVHKKVKNHGSIVRELCSTVHEQCTLSPKAEMCAKKNKIKQKEENAKRQTQVYPNPNTY